MTQTQERGKPEGRLERYEPKDIEPRWRQKWQADQIYKTVEDPTRPKFYCLDFFPYPSGDGLSVGHVRNYVPTDVISRFYRMRGYNVLHPMGWDSFGLPAENEAILKGRHPRDTVPQYTANYRRQLNLVGASYDWTREINSSSPEYYKWTQWFFLLLYKRGLAYRANYGAWFCPTDATVLANEEVEDGLCWRCGTAVVKKDMPQWFFRITAYADRLIEDLDEIDWPERIKLMQRNWIGRSEGAEFLMKIQGRDDLPGFRVFTTRPDTSFGMTFAVLAPEHPLVREITTPERKATVAEFAERVSRTSEIERQSTEGDAESRGVFTGAYAINPFTEQPVPIFIADYVLVTYGTGAIMAVPGQDQRDWDFAKAHSLPIIRTVQPPEGWEGEAYTGDGPTINSEWLNDAPDVKTAKARATGWLESRGIGEGKVNYRLRDWLISRQRYWGAPIPIIHCPTCGEVPVPADQLPVMLPPIEHYQPSGSGESPLSTVDDFVNTTCPTCGGAARRETDTMGGFACSSWYFLRFTSPDQDMYPFDPQAMRYWMPVDLYVGGAEHAVMHLLYARFWTKVMFDAEIVPFVEPFQKLMNQGVVHASDGLRMSKSKGNVITPDSVVEKFGADALRAYELFMAPFDQNVIWNDDGVRGMHRWLNRIWQLVLTGPSFGAADDNAAREMRRWTHRTVKKATEDIERLHFNTMISALMEYTNFLSAARDAGPVDRTTWAEAVDSLLRMLAPPAPYIAEELWTRLGREYSIHQASWPEFDSSLAASEMFTLVVQVNGKLRDRFDVPTSISEEEAREMALTSPRVTPHTEGKELARVLYVPGRLVNIVVR